MLSMIKNLFLYRGFILSSISNQFKANFARSKLGGFWVILNPLAQAAIFALILSKVLAAKLPGVDDQYSYAIYLLSGTLCWNLFSEVVGRCVNIFIENANIIKKMSFPRITLPVILAGYSTLNNFFLFASLIFIFTLFGHYTSLYVFWVIPLTLLSLCLALGIGLVLGVLNVFLRDISQVVPIVLQMLFWFTPIVYPIGIVPDELQSLLIYNPLYILVSSYQEVLLYQVEPNYESLAILAIASVVILLLSLFMFRRAVSEMADVL